MARLLALLGILAIALVAWLTFGERAPTPQPGHAPGHPPGDPPPAQAPAETNSHGPVAVQDQGAAPAPTPPAREPAPVAAKAADHPDWIAFPDGTALPPLNGVAKAPKITWHRLLPFTKVTGLERDAQGREWYVHENGARSTTYIDARGQAVGELSMPAATKPILEDH